MISFGHSDALNGKSTLNRPVYSVLLFKFCQPIRVWVVRQAL
jgi:hypothetical protein